MVTACNDRWWTLQKILCKNWHILESDHRLAPLGSEGPSLIAKQAQNFHDRLTQSHFSRPTMLTSTGTRIRGTFPCGTSSICPLIKTGDGFQNPRDHKIYLSNDFINCRTRDVVYALICPCKIIYVGQTTQELRKRVQQHLSFINLAKRDMECGKVLTSVAKHFLQVHQG